MLEDLELPSKVKLFRCYWGENDVFPPVHILWGGG